MAQTNATSTEQSPESMPVTNPLQVSATWPIRVGNIPALADRFASRPESGPDLNLGLQHSPVVMLTPRSSRVGAGSSHDLLRCTGKTQLAAYHAEALWEARAVDLLIWIDASSRASILSEYVAAASGLAATKPVGSAEETASSFLGWLANTDRRWLMVLDDVRDADALYGLWPHGPAGRVLVTTVNPHAVDSVPDVLMLELGPFSPREAMTYLVSRLSKDPDQRRGAIDLIQDVGCQPLPLAQATALINSSWLNCVDYREQFYRRMTVFNSPGAGAVPAAAVTWTLSVEHAATLAPGNSAQACLALAALLDGHGIPLSVFETQPARAYLASVTRSADRVAEPAGVALTGLEQAGLLTVDRQAIPPVVRIATAMQHAIQLAMLPEMLEEAGQAAAGALLDAWPASRADVSAVQGLRSGVTYLLRATGGLLWADGCHPVLLRAGQSLDDARLTGPAVDYWSELAVIASQSLPPGHPDSLIIVEHLANAYVAAGRVSEAVAWYERILADWSRALGSDHTRTLSVRVSLGRILVAAGRPADAISILTGALADAEHAYGAGHPECAAIRDELAATYRAVGQLGDAIRLYQLILSERERALGSRHPDTMGTRQLLADAYLADGRTKEAISQFKRVIADRQRTQGQSHPDTLRASGALALAYHRTGRMASAVQLYEQVHRGFDQALGADHPDTLAAALNLGRAYYTVGRLTDASTVFKDTISRGERVLPPGSALTQSARESLAVIGTE
jgi:tetratricopeptide (TPR) repeat protein